MPRETLKPSATVEVNEFYLDPLGKLWYAFDVGDAAESMSPCETHADHGTEDGTCWPKEGAQVAADREVVFLLDAEGFARQPWQKGASLLDLIQYVTRDRASKKVVAEPFLFRIDPPESLVKMFEGIARTCSCFAMITRLGNAVQRNFGNQST